MIPQKFSKPGERIRVVTLYFKEFNAADEANWDAWYRDKCGVILSISFNTGMNCMEYEIKMDKLPGEHDHRLETFFEFEIDKE
jgi:hypothetical protein